MEFWFGKFICLTYDHRLILVDPASGTVELGYPIQDKLDALDPATTFMTRDWDTLSVGDKDSRYDVDLSKNYSWKKVA